MQHSSPYLHIEKKNIDITIFHELIIAKNKILLLFPLWKHIANMFRINPVRFGR
jgi:hypothetical protein